MTSENPNDTERMEFASAFTTLGGGRRGGAARVGSRVLAVVAVVARIAALVLVALVVVDALFSGQFRSSLLALNGAFTSVIPAPLKGSFVFQTPFGGVFRGDFAIAAIIFFVIDWLACRASASLL